MISPFDHIVEIAGPHLHGSIKLNGELFTPRRAADDVDSTAAKTEQANTSKRNGGTSDESQPASSAKNKSNGEVCEDMFMKGIRAP